MIRWLPQHWPPSASAAFGAWPGPSNLKKKVSLDPPDGHRAKCELVSSIRDEDIDSESITERRKQNTY